MRPFLRPGGIERLSLEARLVYTGFAVFLLVGYATSAWLYLDDDLGIAPAAARAYYLGDGETGGEAATEVAPAGGPALELPPEPGAAALRLEKPPRQVVEVFHFHLFSLPVVLLILAHLYMMCAQSTRFKATVIVVAHLATLVHLCAPPLVRFVSGDLAYLVFPSALLMAVTWLYMTLWPVWEMWRAPLPEAVGPFLKLE